MSLLPLSGDLLYCCLFYWYIFHTHNILLMEPQSISRLRKKMNVHLNSLRLMSMGRVRDQILTQINFHFLITLTLLALLALPMLMARQVTCPQCCLKFTAAQYCVHVYAHRCDEFSRRDPVDLPTSKLLPIEVADDSDEVMEDVFDLPAQSADHCFSPNDDPFSDSHEDASNFFPNTNPFSDDHATTSTALLPHNTPIANTSHTFLPSPPSDEHMDSNPSPHHTEDSPAQGPVPSQSPSPPMRT